MKFPLNFFACCRKQIRAATTVVLFSLISTAAQPTEVKLARPTPEQAAWHDCEIGVFVHVGPATWQDSEYDTLATPLEKINPEKLDTDRWVATAEAMGAKYIVFVAKHTGGFCWWQTDTTDYGVRNIPWRAGKGDVMKDLAESCRKRGMKLGVYLSPQDAKFGAGGGGRCANPEAQKRYDKIFRQQLTELLSRYGEMFEVWFDGSSITDVGDILKQYCPKAMVFQGPYATIRWVGNEDGVAPYPNWNSLPLARAKSGVSTGADGNPGGDAWMPNEVDARIRAQWFWNSKNADTLKSVDQLMGMYYQSVGRGAVLLLNIAPDTTGLMPEADAKRAAEFGAEIRRRFGKSIAETSGKGELVELDLGRPTRSDHVITMENIAEGERVREYAIEGLVSDQWKELCRGTSIGHKKIDQFAPTEMSKVRLRIVKSAAEPLIRKLAVYAVCDAPKAGAAPESANVAQKVWEWSAETVGTEWKTVDIDLTPFCKDSCVYQIDFNATGGSPLEIQSLQYIFDGTVLPEFVQKAAPDATRYYLTVTGLGKSLGLRAVVRVSGRKRDSRGTLTIRKRGM
jgi:alpha-L-fucosidase